jgi:trimeric autotransporter adhesin
MKFKFTYALLLPFLMNTAEAQTLTDSLHAHYLFNGNLLDQTSNNYDLSVNLGTTSYSTFSGADQAVVCDGVTRYSTTVGFDKSYFTTLAVSAWFKCSTITGAQQVMLQGTGTGFGLHINTSGYVHGFFDGSSAGSLLSTTIMTDGNWHHVVSQNNGTNTELYIDGVLNGIMAETLFTTTFSPSHLLNVGMSNLSANNFTGELNDMRIYNRTLSPSEISQVYLNIPENILADQLSVSMYPNPAVSIVTFEIGQKTDDITITITDAQGKIVTSGHFEQSNKVEIPFDKPAGVYFAVINMDGREKSFKLVKQ